MRMVSYKLILSFFLCFGCGNERAFADGAIFVCEGFFRRNAVVGKAFISNSYLFLTKIVAQSLDTSKVVMLPIQLKVNDCSLLFIHFNK